VPLERLQIETDGPWCDMRPSHASAQYTKDSPELPKSVKKEKWTADAMVKGRNEPCAIPRVAHAVAGVKSVSVEEVCEQYVPTSDLVLVCSYANSVQCMAKLNTHVRLGRSAPVARSAPLRALHSIQQH